MIAKLKALPLRTSLGVPAFAVALIAFGWATTARGLFDGITLLIGASAFILTLLQRIPVRPKLEVVPRDGGVLIAKPVKPVPPLEDEEIADEQSELCRNEMPRMPAPSFPPGVTSLEVV